MPAPEPQSLHVHTCTKFQHGRTPPVRCYACAFVQLIDSAEKAALVRSWVSLWEECQRTRHPCTSLTELAEAARLMQPSGPAATVAIHDASARQTAGNRHRTGRGPDARRMGAG